MGELEAGAGSMGFGGVYLRCHFFHYSIRDGTAVFCSENMSKTGVLACQGWFKSGK